MIAVGSGGVVNDMIQRGYNLDVDMQLMDGPYGTSINKSGRSQGMITHLRLRRIWCVDYMQRTQQCLLMVFRLIKSAIRYNKPKKEIVASEGI